MQANDHSVPPAVQEFFIVFAVLVVVLVAVVCLWGWRSKKTGQNRPKALAETASGKRKKRKKRG